MISPRQRVFTCWLVLAVLLCAAIVISPLIGSTRINLGNVFADRDGSDASIFFTVRLPRVLFAVVAGAGLAVAGAVYQALLRNDLADPYTLGVSGGASFGALLVLHMAPVAAQMFLLPMSSFACAALAVAFISVLSASRRQIDPTRLLLGGVTLNLLFSSAILLIQYLSDPYQTFSMIRWMMGGVDVGSLGVPAMAACLLAPCLIVIFFYARDLNLLTLGDMTAAHLGVKVMRARVTLLATASLAAAAIVAYAGPIGFVGLLVPHITRMIFGPDHRSMLPACAMVGSLLLLVCDTVARTVPSMVPGMPSSELPVGIVTAFLGAPFFLWLLLRRKIAT